MTWKERWDEFRDEFGMSSEEQERARQDEMEKRARAEEFTRRVDLSAGSETLDD
jgi:hypothetical protein